MPGTTPSTIWMQVLMPPATYASAPCFIIVLHAACRSAEGPLHLRSDQLQTSGCQLSHGDKETRTPFFSDWPGPSELPCGGLYLQTDVARHLLEPQPGQGFHTSASNQLKADSSADACVRRSRLFPASGCTIMRFHTSCMLCDQYTIRLCVGRYSDATTIGAKGRSNCQVHLESHIKTLQMLLLHVDGTQSREPRAILICKLDNASHCPWKVGRAPSNQEDMPIVEQGLEAQGGRFQLT